MENKNPWTYFVECITKNYANFSGRARRKEYWSFFLFNILLSIVFTMLTNVAAIFSVVNMIVGLGILIPGIAVAVRRMHDVGKSGWFILIPIYNLILALTEGDAGPNNYGDDPKNPSAGNELNDLGTEPQESTTV